MTCGTDTDYSKRQLYETIKNGGSYKWTMMVQVMTPQEAAEVTFDPFDVTKVWPRGECSTHPG
jgi:catalase